MMINEKYSDLYKKVYQHLFDKTPEGQEVWNGYESVSNDDKLLIIYSVLRDIKNETGTDYPIDKVLQNYFGNPYQPSEKEILKRIEQQHSGQAARDSYHSRHNDGGLTLEEIIKECNDNRTESMRNYVERHFGPQKIRKEWLAKLNELGLISKDLIANHITQYGLSKTELRLLTGQLQPVHEFHMSYFPDNVELFKGFSDLLIIGTTGAGKTTFLASFFLYLQQTKSMTIKTSKAKKYAGVLMSCLDRGMLFGSTPKDRAISIPIVIEENANFYPINFTDIGGEAYQHTYANEEANYMDNFKELFTRSRDKKINIDEKHVLPAPRNIMFTVAIDQPPSYFKLDQGSADNFYGGLFDVLEEIDVLKDIDSIAIVVTKWDLFDRDKYIDLVTNIRGFNGNASSMTDLDLVTRYLFNSLHIKLEGYAEDYDIDYRRFEYSIGDVVTREVTKEANEQSSQETVTLQYCEYNPKGADKLYNWITDPDCFLYAGRQYMDELMNLRNNKKLANTKLEDEEVSSEKKSKSIFDKLTNR